MTNILFLSALKLLQKAQRNCKKSQRSIMVGMLLFVQNQLKSSTKNNCTSLQSIEWKNTGTSEHLKSSNTCLFPPRKIQNHRIFWVAMGLLKVPYNEQGHLQLHQGLRAPSSLTSNVIRDGAPPTTSLSNLCQCLTTLIIKNFLKTVVVWCYTTVYGTTNCGY